MIEVTIVVYYKKYHFSYNIYRILRFKLVYLMTN